MDSTVYDWAKMHAGDDVLLINSQNVTAEEKSSFTFEDAVAFVTGDLVLA